MTHPKTLRIEEHSYHLPTERIAQKPLQERDASKLLIYGNGSITEDIYRNIATHLPSDALIVFNQTKVIHARLLFKKETGSTIEIFCLEPADIYPDITTAMSQKKRVLWKCIVGGAAKWKSGIVLQKQLSKFQLTAKIEDRKSDHFLIEFTWDTEISFAELLHEAGAVPLPPYMKRNATLEDDERYQTIFAKEEGSVAAPTAGLHFTTSILNDFATKNIQTENITLHVGAGTFQPVKAEKMEAHTMHAEWMEITVANINALLQHLDKNIIAVGTTSLRTLESLYWIGTKLMRGIQPDFENIAVTQWEPYEETQQNGTAAAALNALKNWMQQNQIEKLITKTQIIIAPSYPFKIAHALVTNFHQPKSTLLLLVAAFIGDDWRKVYDYALNNDFRFLSYGDGSLLWRK
jgi:S-adenosylmethionine:tRNA ribosyltransferase-isomerase